MLDLGRWPRLLHHAPSALVGIQLTLITNAWHYRLETRPQAFCSSTCLKLSKIKFVLLAASMVTGKVSADF